MLGRLLHKELVTRAEAMGDRRYQEIELTAAAVRLVPKLASIADENDESFFSGLSRSERTKLVNILLKLTAGHKLNTNPIE